MKIPFPYLDLFALLEASFECLPLAITITDYTNQNRHSNNEKDDNDDANVDIDLGIAWPLC
jgi:hypothetical protein